MGRTLTALFDASHATLRRNADDCGTPIERRAAGSTSVRVYTPRNVFDIARWRAARSQRRALRQAIVSVYAPKGGVGKTMLARELAALLAVAGLRVLAVDLDFQSNLTITMGNYDVDSTPEEAAAAGIDPERIVQYHIGHLLPGGRGPRRTLAEVVKMPFGPNGPHLVPADLTLDNIETELVVNTLDGRDSDREMGKLIALARAGKLAGVDLSAYDVILFDCPPAKSRLSRSALLASDYVVSPVAMERTSTKSLSYLATVLDDLRERHGRSPELIIVGNRFDPRRVRAAQQHLMIQSRYAAYLLPATVRESEDIPRTMGAVPGVPLCIAKPTSPAVADLRAVADSLLSRIGVLDDAA